MDGHGSELEPSYNAYRDPAGVERGESGLGHELPERLEATPAWAAVTLIGVGIGSAAPWLGVGLVLYGLGKVSESGMAG